jgi:hypothetical protein
MNQREKISNSFSDAYLSAMIEGVDTTEVIREFSKDFPELASAFKANAESLDLLYGDMRSMQMPPESEIASAYKKVSERFAPIIAPAMSAKPGFLTQIANFFSASPTRMGASLAIGAAAIIALLWQPWLVKEPAKETAQSANPSTHVSEHHQTSKELALNDQSSSNQLDIPEAQWRGSKPNDNLTATQRKRQDSIDAAKIRQMTKPKSLAAPGNVQLLPGVPGSILVKWDTVPDALSYIVEIRSVNDANFEPVTPVSQTNLRVTKLESGKSYFVRVTATSGERKGLPSDAKSIVVP